VIEEGVDGLGRIVEELEEVVGSAAELLYDSPPRAERN